MHDVSPTIIRRPWNYGHRLVRGGGEDNAAVELPLGYQTSRHTLPVLDTPGTVPEGGGPTLLLATLVYPP